MRQKEAERLFALKREIYLPAIESFSEASGYVGQIATLPIERIQEGAPLLNLARNTSRISLVAPKEVFTKTQSAVAHLLSVSMTLARGRVALEKLSGDLKGVQSEIELFLKRQTKITDRMDVQIDSGKPDQAVMQILHQQSCQITSDLEPVFVRQNQLNEQRLEEVMRLQKRSADLLIPMTDHVADAVVAIRAELGLPLDREWYLSFARENVLRIFSELKQFQENIHDDAKRILKE